MTYLAGIIKQATRAITAFGLVALLTLAAVGILDLLTLLADWGACA